MQCWSWNRIASTHSKAVANIISTIRVSLHSAPTKHNRVFVTLEAYTWRWKGRPVVDLNTNSEHVSSNSPDKIHDLALVNTVFVQLPESTPLSRSWGMKLGMLAGYTTGTDEKNGASHGEERLLTKILTRPCLNEVGATEVHSVSMIGVSSLMHCHSPANLSLLLCSKYHEYAVIHSPPPPSAREGNYEAQRLHGRTAGSLGVPYSMKFQLGTGNLQPQSYFASTLRFGKGCMEICLATCWADRCHNPIAKPEPDLFGATITVHILVVSLSFPCMVCEREFAGNISPPPVTRCNYLPEPSNIHAGQQVV